MGIDDMAYNGGEFFKPRSINERRVLGEGSITASSLRELEFRKMVLAWIIQCFDV